MTGIARTCFRHRWFVLTAWVVLLVVIGGIARTVGSSYANNFTLPGTDTNRAINLLRAGFPAQAGDNDTIVLHARSGSLSDPAVAAAVTPMLTAVAHSPDVRTVLSPYSPGGAAQISRDRNIGYATVVFDRPAPELPPASVRRVISTAESVRSSRLQVELGGPAIEQVNAPTASISELAGVVGAAIILFLAFGSWRGMVTPLITALLAIGVGTSLIELLSQVLAVAQFAPELAVLIGLGVGIDYALFIVSRYRNGLLHGLDAEDAVAIAVDTSGRAVLFAGATVCVALLGLLLLGVSFLVGVSLGAAITVALTVLASITLLPALLGFMGPKILGRRRLRGLLADGPNDDHVRGGWLRWANFVGRRRAPLAAVAVVVMVVIGWPIFSLRLGSSDQGNDPKSQTTRQAYDLLATGFGPGFNGPLEVVVGLGSPGGQGSLRQLATAIARTPDVVAVTPARFAPNRTTAVFNVIARTSPQDKQTSTLISQLRHRVVPAAIASGPIRVAYVGGSTAAYTDFAHVLSAKLPLFVAVVIVVAFLLLMLAFRSLLIPLTASAMNVLAAGAAFGMLVFVFQDGHLGSLFAVNRPGPIESFIPVMLFAILFGLSMDYQVFLVSRMHEEWLGSGDNQRAVTVGQAETGRVITAAASIMILVFLAFVFGGQRQIAEFGLGLAGAVLLDAFVLRTILVPALMHVIGRANWYLPRWLDRVLPHVSIDPADAAHPTPELIATRPPV